jgi:hypothetical protein
MIQPLKLVAYSISLETGADEQATKPAVGCFRCLFSFINFYREPSQTDEKDANHVQVT